MFRLTVPPLELFVRGTLTYWFIFTLFRVVLRRGVGAVGVADVLLLVLIADAAQNAMSGDYKSVTDGAILVSTIIGWSVLVDWLAFRFPRIAAVLEPRPLALVQDGRLNHRNLRQEFISEDELMGKLRAQGIDRLEDVKRATIESDGTVSVIPRDRSERSGGGSDRRQPI